jgi:hypothetical protein
MPDEVEYFCVESRDLTDHGLSFFLRSRPSFSFVVLMRCEPPITNHTVAEVVHCTDVLVYPSGLVKPIHGRKPHPDSQRDEGEKGEPMVLVGCKFVQSSEIGEGRQSAEGSLAAEETG